MDALITKVCNKIDVDENDARNAVGAVLNYVKKNHSDGAVDFEKIMTKVPGADSLMQDEEAREAATEAKQAGGGGMFALIFDLLKAFGVIAILVSLVQPIFGDAAVKMIEGIEDGAELVGVLGKYGITRGKAVQVVHLLFGFMKENVDAEVIGKIGKLKVHLCCCCLSRLIYVLQRQRSRPSSISLSFLKMKKAMLLVPTLRRRKLNRTGCRRQISLSFNVALYYHASV